MDRVQLLKRAHLLKKHPELFGQVSNVELAEFLQFFVANIASMNEAIRAGKLAGYTPQEGKDYVGRREAVTIFNAAFAKAYDDFCAKAVADTNKHRVEIDTRLKAFAEAPKFTEDELWDIAYRAYQFLDLPDFEAIITQNPAAIRDALELLQGDDRLDWSAIKGLSETFRALETNVLGRISAVVARTLGQIRDVDTEGATTGQVLTRRADGTFNFQTPGGGSGGSWQEPMGTVNGSNAVFTVTGEPSEVVSDGLTYFDGNGYTYNALEITMDIPPSSYIRAKV